MTTKPVASLSLDLDNQWSYMKTHGDAGWESLPSYLDVFVPYALELFEESELTVTVFIVGQDAALPQNHHALRMLTEKGHEVGNHSFHHEQWIHTFTAERLEREVLGTADAIERATGRRPAGYRGPGFSWNRDLLDLLERSGYVYDASTFPTYIGPLARLYYFRGTSMDGDDKDKRKHLFGGLAEGLRSVKPYRWDLGGGRRLLEIPVTTAPLVKTPFHLSYLLYLSRFSTLLMSAYLDVALRLCRVTGTEPSFLLHPLDLLGPEQAPQLAFFPGMDIGAERKAAVFRRVLRRLEASFTLVSMGDHARRLERRTLPVRRVTG